MQKKMKYSRTIIIVSSIVIAIGLIKIFYLGNKAPYVTEVTFKQKLSKQKEANGQTLERLRNYGISDDSKLSLEFFFYTDDADGANSLAMALKKLNYKVEPVKKAAGDSTLWLVTGWSTPIAMDLTSVTKWSAEVSELGFKNGCDFDGWGTNPDQEEFEVENGLTPQQYYEQGTIAFESGQVRKAEAYYTKAIAIDPKAILSYFGRAHIKASTGRQTEAIEDYSTAIMNNPTFYEAFENRGAIKDEMGDYDGAIEDYSSSLKLNPTSSTSYLNRGNSKYHKKDNIGACADWRKAKELGDATANDNILSYCK